jgi:hypothetical protein
MDICSICLEATENKLECSHHNCVECIKKLIKKNTSICPICRRHFDTRPYKYYPPRFRPTLKITAEQKRFFNKFLVMRYKLRNGNKTKKKFYSNLMFRYTNQLYIFNQYVSPQEIEDFEKYRALRLYLHFHSPNCFYSNITKEIYCIAIENCLCF